MKLTKTQLRNLVEELVDEGLHPPEPKAEDVVELLVSHGLEEEVAYAIAPLIQVRDAIGLLRQFSR